MQAALEASMDSAGAKAAFAQRMEQMQSELREMQKVEQSMKDADAKSQKQLQVLQKELESVSRQLAAAESKRVRLEKELVQTGEEITGLREKKEQVSAKICEVTTNAEQSKVSKLRGVGPVPSQSSQFPKPAVQHGLPSATAQQSTSAVPDLLDCFDVTSSEAPKVDLMQNSDMFAPQCRSGDNLQGSLAGDLSLLGTLDCVSNFGAQNASHACGSSGAANMGIPQEMMIAGAVPPGTMHDSFASMAHGSMAPAGMVSNSVMGMGVSGMVHGVAGGCGLQGSGAEAGCGSQGSFAQAGCGMHGSFAQAGSSMAGCGTTAGNMPFGLQGDMMTPGSMAGVTSHGASMSRGQLGAHAGGVGYGDGRGLARVHGLSSSTVGPCPPALNESSQPDASFLNLLGMGNGSA